MTPGWRRLLTGVARAALALLLAPACDPDGLGQGRPDFLVIGHHGSPYEAAENTILSFERSLDSGANAVEPDICVTKDGVLVLLHDCDPDDSIALARQSGGEGFLYIPAVPPLGSAWRRPANQLTLEELRAHYGYVKFGEPVDSSTAIIPTLAEFFDWARSEPRLKAVYVDAKVAAGEVDHLVPLMAELSSDDALSKLRINFLSVHPEVTRRLEAERRRLGVDSPRSVFDSEAPGALAETRAEKLRDVSIGLTPARTWSGLKSEVAEAVNAREAGEIDTVMVWTIDRETELAELLYYSVDGIITNEAPLLHDLWQSTLQ